MAPVQLPITRSTTRCGQQFCFLAELLNYYYLSPFLILLLSQITGLYLAAAHLALPEL